MIFHCIIFKEYIGTTKLLLYEVQAKIIPDGYINVSSIQQLIAPAEGSSMFDLPGLRTIFSDYDIPLKLRKGVIIKKPYPRFNYRIHVDQKCAEVLKCLITSCLNSFSYETISPDPRPAT